jgi:hypothetical protein
MMQNATSAGSRPKLTADDFIASPAPHSDALSGNSVGSLVFQFQPF